MGFTAGVSVIGVNIFINLVSSLIYDFGKQFFGKNKVASKTDIYKKINENIDSNLIDIFESGIFQNFLKEPQTIDILYKIVEAKIMLQNMNIMIDLKFIKKNDEYALDDDAYKFLATSLIEIYKKETTVVVPEKKKICDSLQFICNQAADYLFSLNPSNEYLQFIQLGMQSALTREAINKGFKEVVDSLKKLQRDNILEKNEKYEEIKKEYLSILKNKNSSAHIYLLDTFEFKRFYVPPILKEKIESRFIEGMELIGEDEILNKQLIIHEHIVANESNSLDWKHIFDKNNIVYIIGGAGYGKSLFMKKLMNDFENLNMLDASNYLVIYGELKMFYTSNSSIPLSMQEFLELCIKNSTLMDNSIVTKEFIDFYIKRGRCLILLDALDEVDKAKRKNIHDNVIAYFKAQNPNNKICITSRNRGFMPKNEIKTYEIMPLDRTQIEKYVDNIIKLKRFNKSDKKVFLDQANKLVKKGFLNSFLVLSLLINIYKAERELPENKLDLYEKCFEYIANRREKEKLSDRYHWEDIGLLMKDNTFIELANLCFPNNTDISKEKIKERLVSIYTPKFGNAAKAENVIDEFLLFCSDRTELFVPSASEDKYKFFHRSFFEYSYSQYIFTRYQKTEEIYDKLIKFDVDSEVFELTIATLKRKSEYQYQYLIEYIFERVIEEFTASNKTYNAFNILTLCMQVIDDTLYKNKFIELLIDYKDLLVSKGTIFELTNHNLIENENIIIEVIQSNDKYIKKIYDCYYYEAAFYYLMNLKILCMELKKRNDMNMEFARKHRFYFGVEQNFYLIIFRKYTNFEQFIMSLNDEKLKKIKTVNHATRKDWYGVHSSIDLYRTFTLEQKKRFDFLFF